MPEVALHKGGSNIEAIHHSVSSENEKIFLLGHGCIIILLKILNVHVLSILQTSSLKVAIRNRSFQLVC